MDEKTRHIIKDLITSHQPLTEEEVTALTSIFPFQFPKSYINLIKLINGKEGEIGTDSWLCLFPLEELAQTNQNYNFLMKEIPEYFLFGKDAADTGYAFHKVYGTFHSFGLLSNFETDSIQFMGHDFDDFLETLYSFRFKSK